MAMNPIGQFSAFSVQVPAAKSNVMRNRATVPTPPETAALWLDAGAQFMIGLMYAKGKGVDKDKKQPINGIGRLRNRDIRVPSARLKSPWIVRRQIWNGRNRKSLMK